MIPLIKAAWRAIVRWYYGVLRLLAWGDYVVSFLRNPSQIAQAWPDGGGTVPLGPRVAVFIHFDANGQVRPHTLHYVTALHDAGLSVLFVTNSGKLTEAAHAALRPLCAGILVRRNIGYDFGAMREGLTHFALPRPDTGMILLANDSVYGPLCPLGDVLTRIDFDAADFWGLTESWQTRYHLQSFFIAAGKRAFDSEAWQKFWRQVRPVRAKSFVIGKYEVGLTQRLLRAGLRARALWPYLDLVRDVDPDFLIKPSAPGEEPTEPLIDMRRIHAFRIRYSTVARTPLNPTSDLWRQLLRAGFPFLKRELLRDNPTAVADVIEWRDLVCEKFGAVPEMIEQDLQRVAKNRAP